MILGSGIHSGAPAMSVQLPTISVNVFKNSSTDASVYSGVRFGSDGLIYRQTTAGVWQPSGYSWLLDGVASLYWLQRVATGDTLDTDDGDLVQMNTNIDFSIVATAGTAEKNSSIAFDISTDSGGVTLLVSESYSLFALKL